MMMMDRSLPCDWVKGFKLKFVLKKGTTVHHTGLDRHNFQANCGRPGWSADLE